MKIRMIAHAKGQTVELITECRTYEVIKFEGGAPNTVKTTVHTPAGDLQVLDITSDGLVTLGGPGFEAITISGAELDRRVNAEGWFVA